MSDEIRWKAHELDLQLYHHYLDLLLKFNAFFYAVTGAIVSFVLTRHDLQQGRWALLLPVLMAVVYGGLFLCGTPGARRLLSDLDADAKRFGLRSVPDVRLLGILLWISAGLLFVVALCLSALVACPDLISVPKSPTLAE
jgi:hypothetical protein